MFRNINTFFYILTLGFFVSVSSSCVKEMDNFSPETKCFKTKISVQVDDMERLVETKSLLTDPNIETKLTTLTLAVYDSEGLLVDTIYGSSSSEIADMTFSLDYGSYFVYALANMGDMSSSFPADKDDLFELTYSIPGYTTSDIGINDRGIPMVGSLSLTIDDELEEQPVILLKRLMAKLCVHLYCRWPGEFDTVTIHNLNKKLRPFSSSEADSSSDILEDVEISILDDVNSEGNFVFYIPENLQGNVSGISASDDKSEDNTSIPGRGLKSYLEVTITGESSSAVDGSITYRSYLGNNATSNFDIRRNCRYFWDIEYTPDGMAHDDWKHDNDASWSRQTYRFSAYNQKDVIYYNRKGHQLIYPFKNEYNNGILTSTTQCNSNTTLPYTGILYHTASDGVSDLDNTSKFIFSSILQPFDGSIYRYYIDVEYYGYVPGIRRLHADILDDFDKDVQKDAACSDVYVLPFQRVALAKLNGQSTHSLHIHTGEKVTLTLQYRKIYYDGSPSELITPQYGVDGFTYSTAMMFKTTDHTSPTISFTRVNDYTLEYTFEEAGIWDYGWTYCSFNDRPAEGFPSTPKSDDYNFEIIVEGTDYISCDSTPSNAIVNANETVSLQTTFHHFVINSDDVITDVTSSATYTIKSRPTGSTVQHSYNSGTGKYDITCNKGGEVVVEISYGSCDKITKTLTFNDVITYEVTCYSSSSSANVGSSINLTARLKTYTNGVLTSNVYPYTSSSLTFGKNSGSSSSISVNSTTGVVTCSNSSHSTSAMTASVYARYNSVKSTNDCVVTFNPVITNSLAVTKTSTGDGTYTKKVKFKAMNTRTIDGYQENATDVTGSCTWTLTQPLSPARYSVSAGEVTADASVGNHSVAGTSTVTATYYESSASATATFVDVNTSTLLIGTEYGVGSEEFHVALEGTLQLYAFFKPYIINGYDITPSGGYQAISGATWTSADGTKFTVNNSGVITGVAGGNANLTVSYDGRSHTSKVYVGSWNDDWDDPGSEINL